MFPDTVVYILDTLLLAYMNRLEMIPSFLLRNVFPFLSYQQGYLFGYGRRVPYTAVAKAVLYLWKAMTRVVVSGIDEPLVLHICFYIFILGRSCSISLFMSHIFQRGFSALIAMLFAAKQMTGLLLCAFQKRWWVTFFVLISRERLSFGG